MILCGKANTAWFVLCIYNSAAKSKAENLVAVRFHLNQILMKLELPPRGCMPPPTTVAVYIHVCPDSYNICREDFRGI